VWRAYTEVIHCVYDQIPNLQNCVTTPNKNLGGEGPQTDKHLPPSTFNGQFLRKGSTLSVWCLFRYLVHGRACRREDGMVWYGRGGLPQNRCIS
jgi:hypothetical protein